MFPRLELFNLWRRSRSGDYPITYLMVGGWHYSGQRFGGAGGRRSLVVRALSVVLTLLPKFLNRVKSCGDLSGLRSFRVCSIPDR